MVTTTLQRKHKKNIKKPTKKEVQILVNTLNDLLFYSNAHLSNTTIDLDEQRKYRSAMSDSFGVPPRGHCSWGDLNAAIHRAEQVLEGRKGS